VLTCLHQSVSELEPAPADRHGCHTPGPVQRLRHRHRPVVVSARPWVRTGLIIGFIANPIVTSSGSKWTNTSPGSVQMVIGSPCCFWVSQSAVEGWWIKPLIQKILRSTGNLNKLLTSHDFAIFTNHAGNVKLLGPIVLWTKQPFFAFCLYFNLHGEVVLPVKVLRCVKAAKCKLSSNFVSLRGSPVILVLV